MTLKKYQFAARYRALRKDLMVSVKSCIKQLESKGVLKFYGCGYVDHTHPSGKLQIAQLTPPLRFKAEGHHEADEKGSLTITYLTEDGYLGEGWGGGCPSYAWVDQDPSLLIKVNNLLYGRVQKAK